MDSISAWKNFSMGNELNVAGNFLYDGIKSFEDMETLNNTTEIFNFMYYISVGVERLQKVVIILGDYEGITDLDGLVSSIKHHDHVALMDKIRKLYKIELTNNENAFINLLSNFYNHLRYGRFLLDKIHLDDEKTEFTHFLEKRLGVVKDPILEYKNSDKVKKFIGRIIGKISTELYKLIEIESKRLGIYTYEINYRSKAYKIFMDKSYDFTLEKLSMKELIVYLLNGEELKDFRKGIAVLESLDLDVHSLNAMESIFELQELTETVESKYQEYFSNSQYKDRNNILNLLTEEGTDWEKVRSYLSNTKT
ncbi:hypothetical protein FPQ10_06060 [Allobacillus sp. SKP2-8]|uniref:hypothetical protein n=1 Tax=unclassified Allobacillus TaxID=2628859 RepID=UPI00118308C8|nr:hypothetical protein [Allobacillus sp. SKP2-8]TSJ67359.1 hypothetical protein FPQ10_06060 [Allobacillus sp. SKP2-8]